MASVAHTTANLNNIHSRRMLCTEHGGGSKVSVSSQKFAQERKLVNVEWRD